MKKIIVILLVFSCFLVVDVEAKTLSDMKKELQSIKNEQAKMEANAKEVAEKIAKVKKEMAEISEKIKVSKDKEERTKKEIEELEVGLYEV